MFKRLDLSDTVTIYHGDCLEILPTLEGVDAVVTDPPYGIGRCTGLKLNVGFRGKGHGIPSRQYVGGWDNERPCKDIFDAMLSFDVPTFIFGGNYFADILPRSTHWLVWDKRVTMPSFSDCELVWTNSERKSTKIITVEWNGLMGKESERLHATQKPVKIIGHILERYLQVGASVLDPFMGSGTTGIACIRTDRRFIGIEIDEHYFNVARQRLENELAQMRLPL